MNNKISNPFLRFITQYLSMLFLAAFLFLFIGRTFFPIVSFYALVMYGVALAFLLIPPCLLLFLPATKKFYDKQLATSLWFIFGLGFATVLFYFLQSYAVLGKLIILPDYVDSRVWLEKLKLFCQIAYMLLLVAAFIYAGIFQASLKAIIEDTQRTSFLQSAAINIGLLLALLIALNYASTIRPLLIDLTTFNKYSLSVEGRNIVRGIKREVTISAFYSFFGDYEKEIRYMLTDIQKENPNIKFTIIDAIKEKNRAIEKRVSSNGVILFESIDPNEVDLEKRVHRRKVSVVTKDDLKKMERDFVSAILGVTQQGKKIYFSVGHGELPYTGPYIEVLSSSFQDELKHQGYSIHQLDPQTGFPKSVPKDASVIAILGPAKKFSKQEQTILKKYILKGGRIFLALDPERKPEFKFLLSLFNVQFHRKMVHSLAAMKGYPRSLVVFKYTSHPITSEAIQYSERERFSFFPSAGFFTDKKNKKPAAGTFEKEYFMMSNIRSWIDVRKNGKQDKNEPGKEFKLAVALGDKLTVVKKKNAKPSTFKGRLVAFTDASFITNQFLSIGFNHHIASNSMKWLLEDESIMGILPHKWFEGNVKMTNSQEYFVFYFLVFVWPFILLFSGITYVRLRKKRKRNLAAAIAESEK